MEHLKDEEDIIEYLDKCSLSQYATPYLTCCLCNCINFIDITCIRGIKNIAKESLFEYLPPCCGCGRTRHLRAGARSFQAEIEEATQAGEILEKLRVPAAINIQRIVRGRLGRLEAKRRRIEKEMWERKIFNAARAIQTRVRGIQARVRAEIERCIFVIVNAHTLVYSYATVNRPGLPTIFWYDNSEELEVFRWNYREFVYRTGGRPPLWRVEANVREVTRRVLLRENVLVTRIQARWRGITARFAFYELKKQHGWIRSVSQSPAIKIQRLARMHMSRRKCKRLRIYVGRDEQLAAYRRMCEAKKLAEKQRMFQATLMSKYRTKCQNQRTAKIMGAVDSIARNQQSTTMVPALQTPKISSNQHINRFMEAKTKLDLIAKRKREPFPTMLRSQVYDTSEAERVDS